MMSCSGYTLDSSSGNTSIFFIVATTHPPSLFLFYHISHVQNVTKCFKSKERERILLQDLLQFKPYLHTSVLLIDSLLSALSFPGTVLLSYTVVKCFLVILKPFLLLEQEVIIAFLFFSFSN